jgi:hypothetical protein
MLTTESNISCVSLIPPIKEPAMLTSHNDISTKWLQGSTAPTKTIVASILSNPK